MASEEYQKVKHNDEQQTIEELYVRIIEQVELLTREEKISVVTYLLPWLAPADRAPILADLAEIRRTQLAAQQAQPEQQSTKTSRRYAVQGHSKGSLIRCEHRRISQRGT